MQIAIDGPSGAGKSTIAKNIAKHLNIEYLDTGSMYRALGYKLKEIDINDTDALKNILDNTTLHIKNGNIYLDGINVEEVIRTEEAAMNASRISDIPLIRNYLVKIQRKIGENTSIVMDGRDIGSAVLPYADYKFFLTADPLVRAQRRYKQLNELGYETNINVVLKEIELRDHQDISREHSPLIKAKDAIVLDSTNKSIEETTDTILKFIEENNDI